MNERRARHLGELLGVIRDRVAELGVTHETLDAASGLQSGYSSKLLCHPPMRRISPFFMFIVLEALGLEMQITESPEAMERMQSRLTKRVKPPMRALGAHRSVTLHFMPDFIRQRARLGGEAYKVKVPLWRRRANARKAARARWAMPQPPKVVKVRKAKK